MTASPPIPNLWPEDIQVAALPPLFVLKVQADGLRERTRGVLDAEVTTTKGAEDFEIHRLQVVARQLDGSRHGILSVTHRTELYPAVVEAKVFEIEARQLTITTTTRFELPVPIFPKEVTTTQPKHPELVTDLPAWPKPGDWRPVAASHEELVGLLGKVLKSMPVRALIESLLARTYVLKLAAEAAAPAA